MARRGRLRGRLTLRERQALRRGDKVYRNGISVDIDGMPIAGDLDEQGQDRSQWGISGSNIDSQGNAIDPTSPDYVPNFDDDPTGSIITGNITDVPVSGSGTNTSTGQWSWIDDDRIPSQAEIDYYAAMDEGKDPVITQEHLDEIGVTEVTAEELAEPKTEEEIAEDNAPENQPVGPEYGTSEEDPLWTHTDTTQWTAENQPTEEELSGDSLGTDTTPNELAGGSLMKKKYRSTSPSGMRPIGAAASKTGSQRRNIRAKRTLITGNT
jgi:hypothetical protein